MVKFARNAVCILMCACLCFGVAGCKKKDAGGDASTESAQKASYMFKVNTGDTVTVSLVDGAEGVLSGDSNGFAVTKDDNVLAKGSFLSKIVANNRQAQFAPDESYVSNDDGSFSFEALDENNKRQCVAIIPLKGDNTFAQLVSDSSLDDINEAVGMIHFDCRAS